MTLSSKHLQGQLSPPLDTRSAARYPPACDEMWSHGHVWSRQAPPREKVNENEPAPLWKSARPLAGGRGVASPRPRLMLWDPCTGQNRSCTSRLMRSQGLRNNSASEVAFGPIRAEKRACERRAGNSGHRGPHHATFRRASTTRSTARVSAGSQGPAVIEETKENHESSCLPRHERCQR